MYFVFPYTRTDGFTYWLEDYIFLKEVDIETAYIKICDIIQLHLNSLPKNIDINETFINIFEHSVSINQIVNSKGEPEFNLLTLKEFNENIKNNAKTLS